MDKATGLRKRFNEEGLIRIVGAHDGLSAKLVERNGFDAVWASGLEISSSHAVPDANILTMTQYLEWATERNDATTITVIADCEGKIMAAKSAQRSDDFNGSCWGGGPHCRLRM